MTDKIKDIINLAILAPSGENCQPWRFVIRDSSLEIFNLPQRDQSLYAWGQRASLFAHGTLLTNLAIAAKFYGLTAQISLLPEPTQSDLVARVNFLSTMPDKDPLFDAIKSRVSNRKPYEKTPLTQAEKTQLISAGQSPAIPPLQFVEDQKTKDQLGFLAALNEKIIFENQTQHEFFFHHINWTKQEDNEKSIGFFIETLELPPPARFMFKIIRHWGPMRVMNFLKFGNLVAKGNGQVNSSAAAFGAIKVPSLDPATVIAAGESLQRIWLTATNLGLQMQPLTGMLFLELMIRSGNTKNLTQAHQKLISESYQKTAAAFQTKPGEFVIFMFRIGHGAPASARSSRLPAIIEEAK